ncbi:transporter substrate-binding domain-containing protein [Bacillus sp. S/N-304-OC-R1]|uniref:transporter substrate-binding domain-containing protein n=1 Tax=Bacillus sp. S/N-304-OC-R1 TaxID=2758034 RepID=UPI001C8E8511|nr:transporter substrate-binding domain-containing protein [Bacillus sp. S/N-304-OC-R1]MBY0122919.1 transporter substrate-binding domain-containing protein [Bacillus sp. S/N-304-OC-R1]
MAKKILSIALIFALVVVLGACKQATSAGESVPSILQKVQKEKKLVVGTAPGYFSFEMLDKKGNFLGYDMDLGRAIAKSLGVEVEFKQYKFEALIPALQTGEIDMVIAATTIRGDRAKAVSFSSPYYATGQVLLVPSSDTTSKSYSDLDKGGKKIGAQQGTTGSLYAKDGFKNATVVDFDEYTEAVMAMKKGDIDAVIFDEPLVRMTEKMENGSVRGIYELASKENLGVMVPHGDLQIVQWLNSFLYEYLGSADELASREKWFESFDWIDDVQQ